MGKKITMTDIARELGVSQTLVSFVLSGKNDMGISTDTKKKVLKAAERMGYCTGTASKMLKLGRCGYMAVVFAGKLSDGLADILSGVCTGLSEFGYEAVITNPEEITNTDKCLQMARDKRADGFIICGSSTKLEAELSEAEIAFVRLEDASRKAAKDCAVRLCEAVLACGDANAKKVTSKKKASVKGVAGKSRKTEPVAEAKPEKAASEKKAESIWLL